jgi:hypothetical protein
MNLNYVMKILLQKMKYPQFIGKIFLIFLLKKQLLQLKHLLIILNIYSKLTALLIWIKLSLIELIIII